MFHRETAKSQWVEIFEAEFLFLFFIIPHIRSAKNSKIPVAQVF